MMKQVPPPENDLKRVTTAQLYEVQGRGWDDRFNQTVPLLAWVVSDDQDKAKQAFLDFYKDVKDIKVGITVVRSSSTRPLLVL